MCTNYKIMISVYLTGVGSATGGVVGKGVGNGVGCKTDQKREEEMKRVSAVVYLEADDAREGYLRSLKSRDRLDAAQQSSSHLNTQNNKEAAYLSRKARIADRFRLAV